MSDIHDRLTASLRMDAYNGDYQERSIFAKQVLECLMVLNATRKDLEIAHHERDTALAKLEEAVELIKRAEKHAPPGSHGEILYRAFLAENQPNETKAKGESPCST